MPNEPVNRRKPIDRAAGVLIVVAALIIFARWVYPPRPEWSSGAIAPAQPPALSEFHVPSVEPVEMPDGVTSARERGVIATKLSPPCKFQQVEAGLDKACALRLGIFEREENATRVYQSLLAAKFNPYYRRLRLDGTLHYGVYIGPWLNREEMDRARVQLEEKLAWKETNAIAYQVPIPSVSGE